VYHAGATGPGITSIRRRQYVAKVLEPVIGKVLEEARR
jgi:hypothetical protein